MGTDELTALLRVLRRHGVTSYDTPELKLQLQARRLPDKPSAKVEPKPGEQAMDPEIPFELPELDETDGDPRTVLADLAAKNYPAQQIRGRPSRVAGDS